MRAEVTLVGLDFGTTTSSAVFARATLGRSHTGRVELSDLREVFRSAVIFTPFAGELLDEAALARTLDAWLEASGTRPAEVFGGGAIITGLAARRANADRVARLVRARLHDAVVAAAEDPGFESWLAFMGSAAALSRAHPDTPVLNLDIGGGTTNLALGVGGEARSTGALFVGARHLQVEPGTYRLVRVSAHARALLAHLGITRGPGDTLAAAEVDAVLDFQVSLLEAAVTGRADVFHTSPLARLHLQAPLRLPPGPAPALTFSGGVGELVYARRRGAPPPALTCYGDLGGELAARILDSPLLSAAVLVPAGVGRATSYGLLLHGTQVSGATLFLPRPEALPLVDLPIVGRISASSSPEHLAEALTRVRRCPGGGCLTVAFASLDPAALRATGQGLAAALSATGFPADLPLVLLCADNVAKALGGYATVWGTRPVHLVVLDEIRVDPGAHFVQIGRLCDQVVPVSFHGMASPDKDP